jgi:hypothetical protein
MPAHARAFGAGRRRGRAPAVCLMAQPWTMVVWAFGPRHRTTLPPQRCAGWSADCGAARGSLGNARVRATVACHSASSGGYQPRTSKGSPVPLPGQTTEARTEHAPGLAPTRCPHRLGKTVRPDGRTTAASGASASCLPGKHGEECGEGKLRKAAKRGRTPTSGGESREAR